MKKKRKFYRTFYWLEEHLEIPMFLLAIIWLFLLIKELTSGLTLLQEKLIYLIWILFIFEFVVKLTIAPRRLDFLKNNWITIIALVIPAMRVFRIIRAVSLLNSVRVVNSTRIIRALTSGKRFLSSLKEAQGPQPLAEMDVGILIAVSRKKNRETLLTFAEQLLADVQQELQNSSGINWHFDITDDLILTNDHPHHPSDFLDAASQRMAEGPYDLVTVITDVGLVSRKSTLVAGLSSSVTRTLVISLRKLTTTSKGQPSLSYTDEKVRFSGASLFLHLIAQVFHIKTRDFTADQKKLPAFTPEQRKLMHKQADVLPDRELKEGSALESLIFHILMAFRHPKETLSPLLKNKSLLLPLSLPSLATAAVAPALILVFTAEIWDVGLGMSDQTAILFALISILLASFYLVSVQSLFLPRKEKSILTEHLAVANSTIYLSVFLACIGLFLLVGLLMIILEFYVFPPDLMQTWPTLETGEVGSEEKIRLAVFISTIGVTTGALAGGLDKRTVIQNLALFRRKT